MTLTEYFVSHEQLQNEWSYERNNVSPNDLTPNTRAEMWWHCDKGHEWKARVFSRTGEHGTGCPYCTGRKSLVGFNDLASQRPELAEEWYQPLNGDLKPTDVTLGSNRKVWWQCGEGHVWQAVIYSRTRKKGAGCPVCAGKGGKPSYKGNKT